MYRAGLTTERQPLTFLLSANLISMVGNIMSALAIPWFVLVTTGSGSSTAVTVAVGALPVLVSGVFAGAIIDRIGFRRASVIADVASGVTTLGIPVLHATIGIEFWQLLVLVFLGALLDAPGNAARRSMFPELVTHAGMSLDRANAAWAITGRISTLVGAPLAGILIASIGAANLLFINAASFFISAAISQFLIPSRILHQPQPSRMTFSSYVNDTLEGFRYVMGERVVVWMILGFSVGSLLAEPIYNLILPVYIEDTYDSAVYLGWIFAGLAAGSLVGNVVFVTLSHRITRTMFILGGFLIRGVAFLVMAFHPSWWLITIAIFIGAVALEPVNPLAMSVVQERVPVSMRGRVFSAGSTIGALAFPVGIMAYGWLLDTIGMQATLVAFVIVNLAFPVWMCFVPALREVDAKPATVTG